MGEGVGGSVTSQSMGSPAPGVVTRSSYDPLAWSLPFCQYELDVYASTTMAYSPASSVAVSRPPRSMLSSLHGECTFARVKYA